ncbi:YueI family protein [Enterococcus sp. S86.2]|uniref:YueI family protein n=1 Tax=Enterococcus sp. S86.2 TaxID=3031299 RepID=UPI0026ECAF88|nr:YueI family protein [Enterococcus sp. S86.2]
MTDELQQHLDKGRYGTPLVNPDEQHKYMGTFRERCYLSMTIAQMKNPTDKDSFLTELKKHEDATILLNGQMPESIQGEYIQLATKNNAKFTVVNDFVDANPDSFGLLLVAKEAVNEPVIDVEKKYPEENEEKTEQKPEKKTGFFERLFH